MTENTFYRCGMLKSTEIGRGRCAREEEDEEEGKHAVKNHAATCVVCGLHARIPTFTSTREEGCGWAALVGETRSCSDSVPSSESCPTLTLGHASLFLEDVLAAWQCLRPKRPAGSGRTAWTSCRGPSGKNGFGAPTTPRLGRWWEAFGGGSYTRPTGSISSCLTFSSTPL